MYNLRVLYFLASCCLLGCSPSNKPVAQQYDQNSLISAAVADYANTSKQLDSSAVFFVTIGTLKPTSKVSAIGILPYPDKVLFSREAVVGSKGKMPFRFIEEKKRLFFWRDDDAVLDEQTLAIFKKYNLLLDDMGGLIKSVPTTMGEDDKGTTYYFCKSNILVFRKIISSIAPGYEKVPKVKCKSVGK